MINLGKVYDVPVRDIWPDEARDFTPWLAKNPEVIEEILGLTLTDIRTEVAVESYSCDIVAKDETSGDTIIIENQLAKTDHDHLGKIITYAAGLKAKVIVWISPEITIAHRAAIEWLNNNLEDDIDVFLLQLKAIKIDDSNPSMVLEVVEQPNGYARNAKKIASDDMSTSEEQRLIFWTAFNDVIAERGKPINIRKATTDHWYHVAIGTSKCHISFTLVNSKNKIGVELYISDKDLYDDLYGSHQTDIEAAFGHPLEWNRNDNKKASRVIYYISGLNFDDHSNYDSLMNEMINKALLLKEAVVDYI